MGSYIYKYENVSNQSLSSYVQMQLNDSNASSFFGEIRNTINQAMNSDVKRNVLEALNHIENSSSYRGSVASLKKNLGQVESALHYFPDYKRYLRMYENADDEEEEERYYQKARTKLEAIDNRLE